jgi:hypothetical protein
MSTLLRQHPAPAVSKLSRFEQRRESRYKCPKLARVFPIDSPKSLARLSLVRDLSANGIGLLLTRSMSPGTLMNVELCGRAIINRVARVVHSTRAEEGWIIGCTLDNPLCDQELQELGS